jgi:hypothetical protein
LLLVVQTGLIVIMAWRKSVTNDEIAHIPAAISYLLHQRFELYSVNPPLARFAAGWPVLLVGCETDWSAFQTEPGYRSEWRVGGDFIQANKERYHLLLFVSRLGLLPFLWIGTLVAFAWARDLAGERAAWFAAILWVFDPNILGNGGLVTCDVPAAAMGGLAAWRCWHWLREPGIHSAYLAGVCCGLALLSKTVWLILLPLWALCWIFQRFVDHGQSTPRASAGQLLVCLSVALFTLNVGYAFEGTGRKLGDYEFISSSLRGAESRWRQQMDYGNRFRGTWLETLPVPLPRNFLQGLDEQREDFESGRGGYVASQYHPDGVWYYYAYGLLVKEPVGGLLLSVLALCAVVAGVSSRSALTRLTKRDSWNQFGVLLLHSLSIFVLVSSQSGLNSYFRYLLPAYPAAIVLVATSVNRGTANSALLRWIGTACLTLFVLESLSVFPHSLSFFNAAVGGPRYGGRHLLGSNLDWGQDMRELARWQAQHPDARPLRLLHTNFVRPDLYELDVMLPEFCRPSSIETELIHGPLTASAEVPAAGWYAISPNYLYSRERVFVRGADGDSWSGMPVFQDWFLAQEPVGFAGWGFHIFHVQHAR